MKIRVKFVIFGVDDVFIIPGEKVTDQLAILNEDFEDYGLEFIEEDGRKYVNDAAYRDLCGNCDLPPDYDDGCCYHWTSMCRGDCDGAQGCPATEESMMKDEHKDEPESQLNIYVVNNEYMNLAGISYFPWRDDAAAARGGIIMHYEYVGGEGDCDLERCTMLTHEVGHALGLWHTHHGVSEVTSCSSCYEYADGYQCSQRGDLCCDTPATPTNNTCSEVSGSDCTSTSWGDTDETNHMSLGPQGCSNHFTPQQVRRMHCWVCNSAVSGWIDSPDCNNNDIPDVCEITSGEKDDCNGNGIPEECESFVDCNENEITDSCDIFFETSNDCDENGVPDECHSNTQQRACCHSGDQCTVTTELCCDGLSGVFVEEQSTCLYGPCSMFGP